MTKMTMSHLTKRKLRTVGIIILKMAQPEIEGVVIKVIMMVLTHTLRPHQMEMTNPQDTMTQKKSKTQ